ncbi:TPA: hypothetical protein ACVS3C_002957 [Enterobacter hormaechei]|uniref:hypothetical protein n=1 Tax=Enterobacter hormaechei TaxID=158836 RepID=UPI000792CF79|nr:hypothetical protein [Enterobacter hormaechei]MCR6683161.1 hypothetical protein [Enterobacter hormaechei]MED5635799.1 hypothetical protein [Enterobacter hormaechei]MZJ52827.1 hypothetical protein [Enterobacter hormaechei]MZJ72988.1 hypothetical protein [Enterobacter hormaechei]MZK02642.1 hypothetical protein [Enterobacter hormaechei]
MVKILILIIFLIAGCAGDTRNDIKNNKKLSFSSSRSADDVSGCILDKLDFLIPEKVVTNNLVDGEGLEIYIGAIQFSRMKYFHRVEVKKNNSQFLISYQRSETDFVPISEKEVLEIIKECK